MEFLVKKRENERMNAERGSKMQTLIGNKKSGEQTLTASQITQFNFCAAKQTCFRFTEHACPQASSLFLRWIAGKHVHHSHRQWKC